MDNPIRTIAARVIRTGKTVDVDDHPIWFGFNRCYNPYHVSKDGKVYHDHELVFLEPRLQ